MFAQNKLSIPHLCDFRTAAAAAAAAAVAVAAAAATTTTATTTTTTATTTATTIASLVSIESMGAAVVLLPQYLYHTSYYW